MLRVLTLNLWGSGIRASRRLDALAGYLAEERPDIVALQEVAAAEPEGMTQADVLADAVGYEVVLGLSTGHDDDPGEGLAVLTDLRADPADTVRLPEDLKDHPRALQQVEVRTPAGVTVRVGNTHLAWRLQHTDLRIAQARAIAEVLSSWQGPCVLLGDLNDRAPSPPVDVLTAAGFADAYAAIHLEERSTFALSNPYTTDLRLVGRRIDHVLVRGLRPLGADIVLDGTRGPVVSDHYGVLARLDDVETG